MVSGTFPKPLTGSFLQYQLHRVKQNEHENFSGDLQLQQWPVQLTVSFYLWGGSHHLPSKKQERQPSVPSPVTPTCVKSVCLHPPQKG